MKNNIHDYSDIINIKRPDFKINKMSMQDRAAQFAPFAAVTGHKESVDEKARTTELKSEYFESHKENLDYKLNMIISKIDENPSIKIKYFLKDRYKSGGKYIVKPLRLKKIDYENKILIFLSGEKISIKNIEDIEFC